VHWPAARRDAEGSWDSEGSDDSPYERRTRSSAGIEIEHELAERIEDFLT
jgi:hypothetical protein